MTRALVVYESLFGNARTIARAVADGLSGQLPATVVAAAEAPTRIGSEVALLVVGGPNHAMAMPRRATREGAVRDHPELHLATVDVGLREWLGELSLEAPGLAAAAFDTRMDHPRMLVHLDHASRTEERLLTDRGCRLVAPAEHFRVTAAEGPLQAGEEDRAREWGAALAREVAPAR
ncbi:flavodoxin family protein [Geodermatophilus sp. SYSU D00758]